MVEWKGTVMKHLLIILSILLLSSPVIGDNHKGETLYLWETSSGRFWKGFGDKETQTYYIGEVKNGKLHGFGVMYFHYGMKYVGEYRDGLPWTGRFYEKNGDFSYRLVNGKKPIGDY